MSTVRIYRDDQYASSCITKVTDVREKDGFDLISCRESVFYPEGGGQPSDIGSVSIGSEMYEISHASDESIDSDVWHLTNAPSGSFHVGDEIELAIDYDFRFKNMQRHLGEHMLSGTMYSLYGGINKGFHIGDDYVTIDIDLDGYMLTDEELDLAEKMVNEAIWADLPVTTEWFGSYEESLIRPVRKKVPHDGAVSIVTVGNLDDPYDCIACCGVHPRRSSEVGLLAIYKCEPNKGMNRIYFDCGTSALNRLKTEFNILKNIASDYSCSSVDLPFRLASEADSNAEVRKRLSDMAEYVKGVEKVKIEAELLAAGIDDKRTYYYESGILNLDEMLKMGFDIIREHPNILLIMSEPDAATCLLMSSSEDVNCGQVVKENAPKFGGKGGGRPDNARAMFESKKDMDAFMSSLSQI